MQARLISTNEYGRAGIVIDRRFVCPARVGSRDGRHWRRAHRDGLARRGGPIGYAQVSAIDRQSATQEYEIEILVAPNKFHVGKGPSTQLQRAQDHAARRRIHGRVMMRETYGGA